MAKVKVRPLLLDGITVSICKGLSISNKVTLSYGHI